MRVGYKAFGEFEGLAWSRPRSFDGSDAVSEMIRFPDTTETLATADT